MLIIRVWKCSYGPGVHHGSGVVNSFRESRSGERSRAMSRDVFLFGCSEGGVVSC